MRIAFCILPALGNPPGDARTLTLRAGVRSPVTLQVRDPGLPPPWHPFPYHLACAASHVGACGDHEIVFRDSACLYESRAAFLKWIEDFAPDAVVFEATAAGHLEEGEVMRHILARFPKCRVCACGPFVSRKTARGMLAWGAAACVIGEYENGVDRFVGGADGVLQSILLTEEQMNEAPLPWMQDDLMRRYRYPIPVAPRGLQVQALSSRGCLYHCTFCSWPAHLHGPAGENGPRVRAYGEAYMERLLADARERFSAECVHLDDDTFNLSGAHVRRISGVLQRFGMGWTASCRIDHGEDGDWLRMRDAGCYGVVVGLETGSQWLMDKVLQKGVDLARARDRIEFLRGIGMSVCATFMAGIPGETDETRRQTENYRRTLAADCIQVLPFSNVGIQVPVRRQAPGDTADRFIRSEADAAHFGRIRESADELAPLGA